MPNYVVSGAGDAGYNGTYIDIGVAYPGFTPYVVYQLDSTHFLFNSSGFWYLSSSVDSAGISGNTHYYQSDGGNPSVVILGPYVNAGGMTNPAPTVAVAGAATHTGDMFLGG